MTEATTPGGTPEGATPEETAAALRGLARDVVVRLAPERVADAGARFELRDDLGYDSLALAELAFALEEVFQLPPLPGEETAGISSVGDVEELIAGLAERTGHVVDLDKARDAVSRITPQGGSA
ncbi:hypothetical protein GCM10009801_44390 [Streptomyces albiaxialis]|uniref:Carrier domain-containing protein n=1 Tax=Streptomyces albiaxialis TaxID=329523 RepID=A0ABN2W6Y7_9ACTN